MDVLSGVPNCSLKKKIVKFCVFVTQFFVSRCLTLYDMILHRDSIHPDKNLIIFISDQWGMNTQRYSMRDRMMPHDAATFESKRAQVVNERGVLLVAVSGLQLCQR
jgi:hypothetical protein